MAPDRITDFATGKELKDTPEERVRQDAERWLVGTMGYAEEQIDVEVPIKMGSVKKWVDIAVYKTTDKAKRSQQHDIMGIVETKAPTARGAEGTDQLHSYMAACHQCQWGVRDRGNARDFYHRTPSGPKKALKIPRVGETIQSISRLSKQDLLPAGNLRSIFRSILDRTYASVATDRTRLCNEITKLLFCKFRDEQSMDTPNDTPRFQAAQNESPAVVKKRIQSLWEETLSELYDAQAFKKTERIEMPAGPLAEVVAELENIDLIATDSDVIGTAFEVFAERYFKGDRGEFFTPRAAVRGIVSILNPKIGETIIDPACGSGGFLIRSLDHLWTNSKSQRDRQRASNSVHGIDIEINLVKLARAYMVLVGDGRSNIVEANTLKTSHKVPHILKGENDEPRLFDVLMTNPPFGRKLKIEDPVILNQYELAKNKAGKIQPQEPQILFLEKCISLLKEKGRMAIVMPEGAIGNSTTERVREFVLKRATVEMVIDCPIDTFQPHTGTKTCILFIRNTPPPASHKILMTLLKDCGHDARGNPTGRNDFPQAVEEWKAFQQGKPLKISKAVRADKLVQKQSLVPSKYVGARKIQRQSSGPTIGDAVDKGLLSSKGAGGKVEQKEYITTGGVPYLKTVCIGNQEILDAKDRVSMSVYKREKPKQDLRAHDILVAKDGGERIGNAVLLEEEDLKMVIQGHFWKIRSLDHSKLNPYWLLKKLTQLKPQIQSSKVFQTNLSSLTKDELMSLPLEIAPTAEQNQIGDRVRDALHRRRDALKDFKAI